MEYTFDMFEEDFSIAEKVFFRKFYSLQLYKDDLIQEGVIRLWLYRSHFDMNKGKYSTFAYMVAYQGMLMFLRHNKVDNLSLDFKYEDEYSVADVIPSDESPFSVLEYNNLKDVCFEIVKSSKSNIFKKISILYLKGYSPVEIKFILNVSRQCVHTYLNKFKNILRANLSNDEVMTETL